MSDVEFADGFFFKRNDNAPDWAIGKLSINLDKARKTFSDHVKDGWLNLEIKQSKNGKYYVQIDTWEPNPAEVNANGMMQAKAAAEPIVEQPPFIDDGEDLPF